MYVYQIIRCQFEKTTVLIVKLNVDDKTVLINGFRYTRTDTNVIQIKLSLSRSRRQRRGGSRFSLNLVARWRFVVGDMFCPLYPRGKILGTN